MWAGMLSPQQVHDLVLLDSREFEHTGFTVQPEWARHRLRESAWAVVLRAQLHDGMIPIGIRGFERQQRWSGFVHSHQIIKTVAPSHLRSDRMMGNRMTLSAMRALCFLESQLSLLPFEWGPGGSVAYELASGEAVVRHGSDLDVIIRAPQEFEKSFASELIRLFQSAPANIDCRVETPWCGFSLEEYAQCETRQLLVRTCDGPLLLEDPWSFPILRGKM